MLGGLATAKNDRPKQAVIQSELSTLLLVGPGGRVDDRITCAVDEKTSRRKMPATQRFTAIEARATEIARNTHGPRN